MRKKILSPVVYPTNKDITRTWFVKYYNEVGKPIKIYGNLNKLETVPERLKEARTIIKKILSPSEATEKVRVGLVDILSSQLEQKKATLEKISYQNYFNVIKLFAVWYYAERRKNKDVPPTKYFTYLLEKGVSKNTVRKRIVILKHLSSSVKPNPFDGYHVKKVKAQSKLPFSDKELSDLIPYIKQNDYQLYTAINFLFYLFFRPNELRFLKVEHLIFDEYKVLALPEFTKDDDFIKKKVPGPMRDLFNLYKETPKDYYIFGKNGNPSPLQLGKNSLSTRCTEILRSKGFGKRYTLYSFVHTGIKKAAMSGVPFKQLQIQKGHSDLNMFDQYMKDLGIEDCVELVTNFPSIS